jgi:UDP-N-acetylglucosamine 1-carboxyvinyltransferase
MTSKVPFFCFSGDILILFLLIEKSIYRYNTLKQSLSNVKRKRYMAVITPKKRTSVRNWQKTFEPAMLEESAALWIHQSHSLQGTVSLVGAKNAVLVIMASLILTEGKSVLHNVPDSSDVLHMISVLQDLGAEISFDEAKHTLEVDTTFIRHYSVKPELMKKMRASVLVMGPLLARFSKADIAMPGGCLIGSRPIDYHLKGLAQLGVEFKQREEFLYARVDTFKPATIVLEYPSVGATENILMAAVQAKGTICIVNAALEPEVTDLISVLKKMGAQIMIEPAATIVIEGVDQLQSIEHTIVPDRLEAGSLLLAAAITGGRIELPNANFGKLAVFLEKLREMGHKVECGADDKGIIFQATQSPKAVSFRTAPYPGFPTDLQAPMMAALCLAEGKSMVHETVFENRFLHIRELQKMGAQIVVEGDRAEITGVDTLYGASVIASDIRASCALVLAGLAAKGTTIMTGLHHWHRGYEALETKLASMGAQIILKTGN